MGNKIIHLMTLMVKSTVIVKILEAAAHSNPQQLQGWHNARLQ